MNEPAVLYERPREHVALITLNRPDSLNALGREISAGIQEAFATFHADDEAWVGIVTGRGRGFCAGAHLKEAAQRAREGAPRRRGFTAMGGFGEGGSWKPMIAAINGYAMGGGWALAQRCDIRIAAEGALLGIPETRWHLPAGFIVPLVYQMPMAAIMELVMTGKPITAQRAYEIGFVNKVVPAEQLLDAAFEYAETICENSPLSVRAHKELIARTLGQPPEIANHVAQLIFDRMMEAEDVREGPASFAEKRKPEWKVR